MNPTVDRRQFLEISAAASLGMVASVAASPLDAASAKPVRVGVVGTGRRGRSLLGTLVEFQGVEVPALCDIDAGHLKLAQEIVTKSGRAKAEHYAQGDEAFKALMTREDLDAVLIATPWEWHTPMAVYGMEAGKYIGVEVPAAITLEDCWKLVDTHEKTGVPCMMLENWSFRRDNLAVLNMIRQGLLGEIVHCHCAHSHDCIDHWFWDRDGNPRWPAKYLIERNADQYPTHSLGPVLSWLDIPCGDNYRYLTSTATSSLGINAYFARKFGPEHPAAKQKYTQGDIVTTVIKTERGRTIVVNYDMQLPRPYDNRWTVQGTMGIYNEQRESVYVQGRSPKDHEWEPFAPYQEEFDHRLWKQLPKDTAEKGHGGTDALELQEFLRAVRHKTQTPIDVYESVLMSCIVPLSEQSIARCSAPVECPDFTRGRWKTRKPTFATEG